MTLPPIVDDPLSVDTSKEPWAAYLTWHSPSVLDAPNEPDDLELVERIAQSMKRDGWLGRPLLARKHAQDTLPKPLECLTGSHRIAAALAAGLETVPLLVVECDEDLDSPPSLDPLEDTLRFAVLRGAEFADAVRALWDAEDGYPSADASSQLRAP